MPANSSFRLQDKVKLRQSLFIRFGASPQTLVSRIEDWYEDRIHVSGISSDENHFAVPYPGQKIELFILIGGSYYRSEVFFIKMIEQPIYLWVLSMPKKFVVHQDRRQCYRLENVAKTFIQEYPNIFQDYEETMVKNICLGGAMLISRNSFDLRTKIVLKFPDICKYEFLGHTLWKSPSPKYDKWYYGMKFLNISPEALHKLDSYVKDRLAKGAAESD